VASRNVYVRPFQYPLIQDVLTQKTPADKILADQPIVLGDTVYLRGQQLKGDVTYVRIGDLQITPLGVTPTEIQFKLAMGPFPAHSLRAGIQGIQVVQPAMMGTPETEHIGIESNVAAIVVHPAVTATATHVSSHVVDLVTYCTDDVTLNFTPDVGVHQRVVLMLNEYDPPSDRPARSYRFDVPFTPPSPTDTYVSSLSTPVAEVAAGTYLVRVMVDGAESLLDTGSDPVHPLFQNPTVDIS
jgi:hypothetical protein